MQKGSGISSNSTCVTVNGLARGLGLTSQRVYQLIGEQEIAAPSIPYGDRGQRVYSLDEAVAIWKERSGPGFLVEVSSNQSR